jgi:hypothetical protein
MASCIGSTVMPSPEKLFRGSPTVATADAVGVRKVDARRFPVVSRSAPHRRPGLAGWEAHALAPWLRLGWSSRSDEMNADCSCPSSAGVLSNGNLLVAVAAFAQLSPPRVHQMSSARTTTSATCPAGDPRPGVAAALSAPAVRNMLLAIIFESGIALHGLHSEHDRAEGLCAHSRT